MLILIITAYFLVFYIIGQLAKNNGLVDVGWGFGFVLIAFYKLVQLKFSDASILLFILVFVWGVRLTIHLFKRNVGKPEDSRYQDMRNNWGDSIYIRGFLQIYMLQGALMLLIALPLIYQPIMFRSLSLIGLVISIIGIGFETIGDHQLKQHKKKKDGTLMTTGLWSITRHPNYFGDALFWSGIEIFVLINRAPWWTIVGPIVMVYLLRFVSGVPLLEEKMKHKSGWQKYKEEVPIFVPFIKRREN